MIDEPTEVHLIMKKSIKLNYKLFKLTMGVGDDFHLIMNSKKET